MLYKKVKYSFFNFQKWYQHIYDICRDGDIFVEIGTWTGASALFFGELIKNGDKNINFYTIDTFRGSIEHQNHPIVEKGELLDYFLKNREPLKDYINMFIGDSNSLDILNFFENESVSAIFFDGDHSHQGILKNLNNWYPKVKKGGLFSGHDYIWGGKGVKPVVDAFADKPINHIKKQGVWWYVK